MTPKTIPNNTSVGKCMNRYNLLNAIRAAKANHSYDFLLRFAPAVHGIHMETGQLDKWIVKACAKPLEPCDSCVLHLIKAATCMISSISFGRMERVLMYSSANNGTSGYR